MPFPAYLLLFLLFIIDVCDIIDGSFSHVRHHPSVVQADLTVDSSVCLSVGINIIEDHCRHH